jgi:hypothetical protein
MRVAGMSPFSELREREGEAPPAFAGGGGDVSPFDVQGLEDAHNLCYDMIRVFIRHN